MTQQYSFLTEDLLSEGLASKLWNGVKTAGKNTLYNTGYIIGKSKKPIRQVKKALASDTAKTLYKGTGYAVGGTALGVGALGAAALSD